mmetsp:Transcript_62186/g.131374  ORF Transcript_62186/g.131374 Transcript_62186/m.131374 type:complete len:719 (+) Transcript_62186:367-2523(+)
MSVGQAGSFTSLPQRIAAGLSYIPLRCPLRRRQIVSEPEDITIDAATCANGGLAAAATPLLTTTTKPQEDLEQDERICRYCFEGEEGGELISPCKCAGGQKWVHLTCLRSWQRTVLVSQPTHPDLYDMDTRQRICNVCKSDFTCPPPTRAELLATFTGPGLAALIEEGCIIASAEDFSWELEQQVIRLPMAMREGVVYRNWIRGAFLIVKVVEDIQRGSIALHVSSDEDWERFSDHLGADGETFHLRGRRFCLLMEGPLSHLSETATAEERREAIRNLQAPVTLRLRPDPVSDAGEDGIVAVNLTRPFDLENSRASLDIFRQTSVRLALNQTEHTAETFPAEITHFLAGPCEEEQVAACFVIANGKYTVFRDPDCLRHALTEAENIVRSRTSVEAVPETEFATTGPKRGQLLSDASTTASEAEPAPMATEESGALRKRRRVSSSSTTLGSRSSSSNDCEEPSPENHTDGPADGEEEEASESTTKRSTSAPDVVAAAANPAASAGTEADQVKVYVFWGYAGWSRCQLMGEIARGSWGLCKGENDDVVVSTSDEVWNSVYPRLIFAPRSEMSENYRSEAPREEEEDRRELRRAAMLNDIVQGRPVRRRGGRAARMMAARLRAEQEEAQGPEPEQEDHIEEDRIPEEHQELPEMEDGSDDEMEVGSVEDGDEEEEGGGADADEGDDFDLQGLVDVIAAGLDAEEMDDEDDEQPDWEAALVA